MSRSSSDILDPLVFKTTFRDDTRRWTISRLKPPTFDELLRKIRHEFYPEQLGDPTAAAVRLRYHDEDGDLVTLAGDADLKECLAQTGPRGAVKVLVSLVVDDEAGVAVTGAAGVQPTPVFLQPKGTPARGAKCDGAASGGRNSAPGCRKSARSQPHPMLGKCVGLPGLDSAFLKNAFKGRRSARWSGGGEGEARSSEETESPTPPSGAQGPSPAVGLAPLVSMLAAAFPDCDIATKIPAENIETMDKALGVVAARAQEAMEGKVSPGEVVAEALSVLAEAGDKASSTESKQSEGSASDCMKTDDVASERNPTVNKESGETKKEEEDTQAIHLGVCCDGCGMGPIVGPRFKSLTKPDFDLCQGCEASDNPEWNDLYARLDKPAFNKFGRFDPFSKSIRPLHRNTGRLGAEVVCDVTVPPGTKLIGGQSFVKTWKVKNSATKVWPKDTIVSAMTLIDDNLVDVFGVSLVKLAIPDVGIPVGAEFDISIEMKAPLQPGSYETYYKLAVPEEASETSDGLRHFGETLVAKIEVDETPEVFTAKRKEAELEEKVKTELNTEVPSTEVPVASEQQKVVQELLSRIEDGTIERKDVLFLLSDLQLSADKKFEIVANGDEEVSVKQETGSEEVHATKAVKEEEKPTAVVEQPTPGLQQLQEMGFKDVSLMPTAVVEQPTPGLQQLQEMGFKDVSLMERLLKKYNGDISSTVSDLMELEAQEWEKLPYP